MSFFGLFQKRTQKEIIESRVVKKLVKILNNRPLLDRDCLRIVVELRDMKIKDAQAVKPLIQIIENPKLDWNIKSLAGEVLSQIGDPAVEPLILALENSESQQYVIWALRRIKDSRASEPLMDIVKKTKDNTIRDSAIKTLGIIGDVRVAEPLIDLLIDNGRLLSEAFSKESRQDNSSILSLYTIRRDLIKTLEALGKTGDVRVVDSLVNLLEIELSDDRALSEVHLTISSLGIARSTRAVELLMKTLKDKDLSVRGEAAQALGQIGDSRSIESLLFALKSSDWSIDPGISSLDRRMPHDTPLGLMAVAIERLIEKDGNRLDSALLLKLINLEDQVFKETINYHQVEAVRYEDMLIDCSQIRHLAYEELIRRGEHIER